MSAIVSFQPNFTSEQRKDPNIMINPCRLLFRRALMLHIEGPIGMEDFYKGKKKNVGAGDVIGVGGNLFGNATVCHRASTVRHHGQN